MRSSAGGDAPEGKEGTAAGDGRQRSLDGRGLACLGPGLLRSGTHPSTRPSHASGIAIAAPLSMDQGKPAGVRGARDDSAAAVTSGSAVQTDAHAASSQSGRAPIDVRRTLVAPEAIGRVSGAGAGVDMPAAPSGVVSAPREHARAFVSNVRMAGFMPLSAAPNGAKPGSEGGRSQLQSPSPGEEGTASPSAEAQRLRTEDSDGSRPGAEEESSVPGAHVREATARGVGGEEEDDEAAPRRGRHGGLLCCVPGCVKYARLSETNVRRYCVRHMRQMGLSPKAYDTQSRQYGSARSDSGGTDGSGRTTRLASGTSATGPAPTTELNPQGSPLTTAAEPQQATPPAAAAGGGIEHLPVELSAATAAPTGPSSPTARQRQLPPHTHAANLRIHSVCDGGSASQPRSLGLVRGSSSAGLGALDPAPGNPVSRSEPGATAAPTAQGAPSIAPAWELAQEMAATGGAAPAVEPTPAPVPVVEGGVGGGPLRRHWGAPSVPPMWVLGEVPPVEREAGPPVQLQAHALRHGQGGPGSSAEAGRWRAAAGGSTTRATPGARDGDTSSAALQALARTAGNSAAGSPPSAAPDAAVSASGRPAPGAAAPATEGDTPTNGERDATTDTDAHTASRGSSGDDAAEAECSQGLWWGGLAAAASAGGTAPGAGAAGAEAPATARAEVCHDSNANIAGTDRGVLGHAEGSRAPHLRSSSVPPGSAPSGAAPNLRSSSVAPGPRRSGVKRHRRTDLHHQPHQQPPPAAAAHPAAQAPTAACGPQGPEGRGRALDQDAGPAGRLATRTHDRPGAQPPAPPDAEAGPPLGRWPAALGQRQAPPPLPPPQRPRPWPSLWPKVSQAQGLENSGGEQGGGARCDDPDAEGEDGMGAATATLDGVAAAAAADDDDDDGTDGDASRPHATAANDNAASGGAEVLIGPSAPFALRLVNVHMSLLPAVVRLISSAGRLGGSVPAVLIQPGQDGGSGPLLPAPPPPGFVRTLYQQPDGSVLPGELVRRGAGAAGGGAGAAQAGAGAGGSQQQQWQQAEAACEGDDCNVERGVQIGEPAAGAEGHQQHLERGGGGGGCPAPLYMPAGQQTGTQERSGDGGLARSASAPSAGGSEVPCWGGDGAAGDPAILDGGAALRGEEPRPALQRDRSVSLQLPTGLIITPLRPPPAPPAPAALPSQPWYRHPQPRELSNVQPLWCPGEWRPSACGAATVPVPMPVAAAPNSAGTATGGPSPRWFPLLPAATSCSSRDAPARPSGAGCAHPSGAGAAAATQAWAGARERAVEPQRDARTDADADAGAREKDCCAPQRGGEEEAGAQRAAPAPVRFHGGDSK